MKDLNSSKKKRKIEIKLSNWREITYDLFMLISLDSLAPENLALSSSPLFLNKSLLPKVNIINNRIWLLVFEECIILLYLGQLIYRRFFQKLLTPYLQITHLARTTSNVRVLR